MELPPVLAAPCNLCDATSHREPTLPQHQLQDAQKPNNALVAEKALTSYNRLACHALARASCKENWGWRVSECQQDDSPEFSGRVAQEDLGSERISDDFSDWADWGGEQAKRPMI